MEQIKFLLSQQVLSALLEKKDQAFNKLDVESFYVYNFLKDEYLETKDITTNHLFQFTYRSFYRLDNAGLTKEFKNRYFELFKRDLYRAI
jgi:hypothetical protein